MECECNTEKIKNALLSLNIVVSNKEQLPILSCVILQTNKNSILLKSTNLETLVEISIPAKVKNEGNIAVPANAFLQTLQGTLKNKITLIVTDNNLEIVTTIGKTVLKTIPGDEFPDFKKPNKEKKYKIPTRILIEGIKNTQYASSKSIIRPELSSIFITNDKKRLIFVSTDSFRLSEKKFFISDISNDDNVLEVLIPTKNAIEIINILSGADKDGFVNIIFDDSQIHIWSDNIYIASRTINALFPAYNEIIPKEFITEAVVLKEEFSTYIKKTKIFSKKTQQIGFHIYPSKKIFTITANNQDIGETSDNIDAVLEGKDLDINFNLNYLTDCLQSINSDSLVMKFAGNAKALVIKPVSDNSFMYLVMPLNR